MVFVTLRTKGFIVNMSSVYPPVSVENNTADHIGTLEDGPGT